MVNVAVEASTSTDDRSTPDPIIAAIDVGTNSIHMVVVRIKASLPAFSIIAREKETVRLGDRDPKTGNLTPEAIERALAALKRCQEIAKSLNAQHILAVATSAVREAPNGNEFIRTVETELGLAVNLISGQEEARRIYLGVLSGVEFNDRPHLIIDIGGGSTELILGDSHAPRTLSSTKIGAVRLTSELVTTDPISDKEFIYLQAYICGQLERPIEEIKANIKPGELPQMVGTSGTIETACTIIAREKTGVLPSRLHGFQLQRKDLEQLVQKLRRLNVTERAQVPGLSERRAEIILPGLLVLLHAMTTLKMESLLLCERSLRDRKSVV